MNQTKGHSEENEILPELLAPAVFIVNKHAKTALDPKYLYQLKKRALNKMIAEGKAKKIGLHYSDNPRFAAQQSDVIISCGEYTFHLPPAKDDLKSLPHLGNRSANTRNPKTILSLSKAKHILESYVGQAEHPSFKNTADKIKFQKVKPASKNYQNPFPSTFLSKGSKY
ncbi:YkyB family protein [Bacillus massiliglaciei]|uniref:YkyB family protein n=1 Tax=Bacillus massiliglaciei TaxID=1816693 RepID=UPI000DA5EFDC|nr:YkyB family protein [Bacillus massiliglaciei]